MSEDRYRAAAAELFGLPEDQVTDEQRRAIKIAFYKGLYADTAYSRIILPKDELNYIISLLTKEVRNPESNTQLITRIINRILTQRHNP